MVSVLLVLHVGWVCLHVTWLHAKSYAGCAVVCTSSHGVNTTQRAPQPHKKPTTHPATISIHSTGCYKRHSSWYLTPCPTLTCCRCACCAATADSRSNSTALSAALLCGSQ